MAFAAVLCLLLGWWRRQRVLLIFALFSAVVGIATAVGVGVMTADSVADAQRALNLRTTVGTLGFPVLLWLVCEIAGTRPRWVLLPLAAVCVSIRSSAPSTSPSWGP